LGPEVGEAGHAWLTEKFVGPRVFAAATLMKEVDVYPHSTRRPTSPASLDAMKALVAKVRNTLARQKGLVSEVRGDVKVWPVDA
jgi:hypothetical protein